MFLDGVRLIERGIQSTSERTAESQSLRAMRDLL